MINKVVVLFLVSIPFWTFAQKQSSDSLNICRRGHYIGANIGGGLQTIIYDLNDFGKRKLGFGVYARLNYKYFFTPHWGVGTGIDIRTQRAAAKLNFIEEASATDEDGSSFVHRTYFNDLKEVQKQTIVGIPIALNYQHELGKRWKIGGALGAEYTYTMRNKFSTKKGNLETRGFYPQYNLEIYDMPNHFLYTNDGLKGSYSKVGGWSGLAEVFVNYSLTKRWDLTFNTSYLIGISDKNKNDGGNLLSIDNNYSDGFDGDIYKGVLNSDIPSKIKDLTANLSVGLRYHLKGKEKKKPVDNDLDDEKPQDNPLVADNEPKDNPTDLPPVDEPQNDITDNQTVDNDNNTEKEDPIPSKNIVDEPQNNQSNQDSFDDYKVDEPVDVDKKLRTTEVNYALNQATAPKVKSDDVIGEIVDYLKAYPNSSLELVGHTCDLGSEQYNYNLGLKRAQNFKELFVKRGIDTNRITISSKGETEPLVPNTSDENRQLNRRVQIIIKN